MKENVVINKIEAYLNSNGWSTESKTGYSVTSSERGSGNGTDCDVDPKVIAHAKTLRKEIKTLWPETKCVLDVCDEWVSIEVSLPKDVSNQL